MVNHGFPRLLIGLCGIWALVSWPPDRHFVPQRTRWEVTSANRMLARHAALLYWTKLGALVAFPKKISKENRGRHRSTPGKTFGAPRQIAFQLLTVVGRLFAGINFITPASSAFLDYFSEKLTRLGVSVGFPGKNWMPKLGLALATTSIIGPILKVIS